MTTPNFAPSAPVVQATPSVEESKAAAITAAQAEVQDSPRAAAPERATRSTPRAAAPIERPASPPASPSPAAQQQAATPVEPEAVAPAPVVEQAASAPAQEAARVDPALLWALGGGALLLVGIGGTALVRRRRKAGALDEPVLMEAPATVEPAPQPVRAPVRARVTPVMAGAGREPAADEQRALETMVAAPPSAENPFLTHAKRYRRARFLLSQRHAPADATPVAPSAPATAAAHREDRHRVHSFGKGNARPGATFLKPRTS